MPVSPHRAVPALSHLSERVTQTCAIAGLTVLAGGVLVVLADIALRKTIGLSVHGTVDITQLCVMATVAGAIPFAFARRAHVSVDAATTALPARGREGLDAAGALLGAAFMAALAWFGLGQALMAAGYGDSSQTIGIPMTWYWAAFLTGCALSALAALVAALAHLAAALGHTEAG